MTTALDCSGAGDADYEAAPRIDCENDYYELRDGLAALTLLREAIANGTTIDTSEWVDALGFVLSPTKEACRRLGHKLHLL